MQDTQSFIFNLPTTIFPHFLAQETSTFTFHQNNHPSSAYTTQDYANSFHISVSFIIRKLPVRVSGKMLYLASIGIDFLSLIKDHPPIISASLADIKSTVDLMCSMDFTVAEFRRIVSMCPEILTFRASDVLPVFTFLLREAKVNGSNLKRVINRRPRLLVCTGKTRLRPTLYFLQSMGIAEVNKHTYLLSCSVEDKFIPRIRYFQKMGFSKKETTAMLR